MTVETLTNRIDHEPDGIQTVFPFNFVVFEEADLLIYYDGTPVTPAITITGLGDAGGGSITFDVAPDASIDMMTLYRETVINQTTDYPTYGPFPAASHERALDELTMIAQQQQEQIDRSLQEPINAEPGLDLTFPPYDAGKALMYSDEEPKSIVTSEDNLNGIIGEATDQADRSTTEADRSAAEADASAASAAAALLSADDSATSAAESEASAQVALEVEERINDTIADAGVNKGTRQTYLSGPALRGSQSTVEMAATSSGDNRFYLDLGIDLITGSRGHLVLFKAKASVLSHYVQSSVLTNIRSTLATNTTSAMSDQSGFMQQPLSNGIQYGSGGGVNNSNVYAFTTTHRTKLDGNVWHYNPTTGFAMCSYVGDGLVRDLRHPMGSAPLWFTTKNTASSSANWPSGRRGSNEFMNLNHDTPEALDANIFPTPGTDQHIPLGVNVNANQSGQPYFLWGWFGDALGDLHTGMTGVRGASAHLYIDGPVTGTVVNTGVTTIQMVLLRSTGTGEWIVTNRASGFDNYTSLNSTAIEETGSGISVDGSVVTLTNAAEDAILLVIGSTVDRPVNALKTGGKMIRKYGTATSASNRVDLGGPFAGGTAGGMFFGRQIALDRSTLIFDTRRGLLKTIRTDTSAAETTSNDSVISYSDTGVNLGVSVNINSTVDRMQYTAFPTTHQITLDGILWNYNPSTGFAMTIYAGDGVAGRELLHPMGKAPLMLWSKARLLAQGWTTYHHSLGETKYMVLNTENISVTDPDIWNDTAPTDTAIILGSGARINDSGISYILYAWFGEDIGDIEPGMVGTRGVSAQWTYTGGSGAMSVDTGIPDIAIVLLKPSSSSGNWVFYNMKVGRRYHLNEQDNDVGDTNVTVEGSTVNYVGTGASIEFFAFGSSVDAGEGNLVTLPASAVDPASVSMADGFDYFGNRDLIFNMVEEHSVEIYGDPGTYYLYMDASENLYYTNIAPGYKIGFEPGAVEIGFTYDIEKARMYNATGVNYPVTQNWVEDPSNPGAVIDGNQITFSAGGGDKIAKQVDLFTVGVEYEIACEVSGYTGSGDIYLPYSDGFSGEAEIVSANGTYTYTHVAKAITGMVLGESAVGAVVTVVAIREVAAPTYAPALFLGQCELAADGSVIDIRTYQQGDLAGSDTFDLAQATLLLEDNPFGHVEVDLWLLSETDDTGNPGEWVQVSEQIKITQETIGVLTSASNSPYRWVAKRRF